jgi:hypothetical protein
VVSRTVGDNVEVILIVLAIVVRVVLPAARYMYNFAIDLVMILVGVTGDVFVFVSGVAVLDYFKLDFRRQHYLALTHSRL